MDNTNIFSVKTSDDIEVAFPQSFKKIQLEEQKLLNIEYVTAERFACKNAQKYFYLVNNVLIICEYCECCSVYPIANKLFILEDGIYKEIFYLSEQRHVYPNTLTMFLYTTKYDCAVYTKHGVKYQLIDSLKANKEKLQQCFLNSVPSYIISFFFGDIFDSLILRKIKACKV